MHHLTPRDIAVIKARLLRGDHYHDVAADYRLSHWRLADLKFGRLWPEIAPATL